MEEMARLHPEWSKIAGEIEFSYNSELGQDGDVDNSESVLTYDKLEQESRDVSVVC